MADQGNSETGSHHTCGWTEPRKNSKLKGFPDDRGPAAVSGAP